MLYTPPLQVQYLGGKSRIIEFIFDSITKLFGTKTKFVDLFSGSGVVGYNALMMGYELYSNDIQPYSFVINKSILTNEYGNLEDARHYLASKTEEDLFSGKRSIYIEDFEIEKNFFQATSHNNLLWREYQNFNSKTKRFENESPKDISKSNNWDLFLYYYRNTYFGVRQCAEIDFIRQYCERFDENTKNHIMACTISALSKSCTGTTHLAQYLKVHNESTALNIINKRKLSIIDSVVCGIENILKNKLTNKARYVGNLDFSKALEEIKPDKNTIIYADPPYFKEHYSRYYHVLDTFVLYDYPELTFNPRIDAVTIGRYRKDRIVSDFGKRNKATEAFKRLFSVCVDYGANLAISYTKSSIVGEDVFYSIAREFDLKISTREFELLHSGQGQPRHKRVTEVLFLISS